MQKSFTVSRRKKKAMLFLAKAAQIKREKYIFQDGPNSKMQTSVRKRRIPSYFRIKPQQRPTGCFWPNLKIKS